MKKMISPVLVVFATFCGYSSPTETPKLLNHLLGDLKPKLYDLDIFTDLTNPDPKSWGTVRITVECLTDTNTIILHYDTKIEENKAKIRSLPTESASFMDTKTQEYDEKKQIYKIILEKSMEKNKNYEIEIEIPEKTYHLVNPAIIQRYATDKRVPFVQIDYDHVIEMKKVFPWVGEPNAKAKFKIRHEHLGSLTAINNAKFSSNKESTYAPNWIIDEFEETVPMPTSALIIALTDLHPSTPSDSSLETEIRISAEEWTVNKEFYMKSRFASVIEFFLHYFQIQSFKKLDVFFLSNRGSSVSVSYGVIFFRGYFMEPNEFPMANSFEEFRIQSDICHVISRQWIGNAVTLLDLRDRWLHIGLNIFLQTLCVKKLNLKWESTFMESSIINSFTNLFKLEENSEYVYSLPYTRMGIISDLYDIFGNYEVERAYHLIRMIDFLLGPDLFKNSIRDYINRFKFSYSNLEDLWNTFTNNIDPINSQLRLNYFTINEIMRSWIDHNDYPLITVTRNYGTNSITISQEPFATVIDEEKKRLRRNNADLYLLLEGAEEYLKILEREDEREKQQTRCWYIPLPITTKTTANFKDTTALQWLTCNGPRELTIDNLNKDNWILFDSTVSVVGCVNYDKQNWISIQKSLTNPNESAMFDALTRARMISNMLALAEIGRLSLATVFDTIKYLPQGERYEHWKLILNWLNKIRPLFFRTSFFKSFEKYVRSLLEPMFRKEEYKNMIQFQFEDHPSPQLKSLIIVSSCTFGVKSCRQESQKLIKKWNKQQGPTDLIPEVILDTILCQGVKHGTKGHWNQLWNQYGKTTALDIRSSILKALGCSNNSKILENYLQRSINENKIDSDDRLTVFQSLSSNKIGYKVMKMFFLKNFQKITPLGSHDTLEVTHYLSELLFITGKRDDLDELIGFAKSKGLFNNPSAFLKNSFKRAIKNVQWLEENEKTLSGYFDKGIFSQMKMKIRK